MGYAFLFWTVSLVYLGLAIRTMINDNKEKLNKIFFSIAVLFSLWGFINGITFIIKDPEIVVVIRRLSVVGWGVIYSQILHFALVLTGLDKKFNQYVLYLFVYGPALMNFYLYFFRGETSEELIWTTSGWVMNESVTRDFVWYNYFFVYYSVFTALTLMIFFMWSRRVKSKRLVLQGRIITVTLFFAFFLGSSLDIVLPVNGFNIIHGLTLVVALIPIGGIWFAMEKYGMMSFAPDKLAAEVFGVMSEGVIICDKDGAVQMMNVGAEEMTYQGPMDNLKINDILSCGVNLQTTQLSVEGRAKKDSGEEIEVLISSMPLLDAVNEQYGSIVIFQDITSLKDVQEQLLIMNEDLERLVTARTKELMTTNDELAEEILKRKKANDKISHMAFYDYLTDLPNLRYFIDEVDKKIKSKTKFAVLCIDFDDFKRVNDILGHAKGDQMLIALSEQLQLKKDDGFLARKHGAEFLLIHNFLVTEELETLVHDLVTAFEKPFKIGEVKLNVTCNVGVSIFPDHSMSRNELVQYADIAMYEAKNKGRNKYVIFDDVLEKELTNNFIMTNELYDAQKNGEFELYYQPQIDTFHNKLKGVEALIRWNSPSRGLVSPSEFVPLLEKSGLIIKTGEWVIKTALDQAMEWQKTYGFDIPISVNLSGQQLLSELLIDYLKTMSQTYDITCLEFEVTENIFLNEWVQALKTLNALDELNVRIAIDDFGVEYSSLKYIKNMPVSKIKIDKFFVDGISKNEKDEAIIKTIVALANNLKVDVVAEGVEHLNQSEFLSECSCHYIQGFYYSKPLKVKAFEAFIEKNDYYENKRKVNIV